MPHIMELLGKTRVIVKDGKGYRSRRAKSIGALFAKFAESENHPEEVRKNMEFRINDFGMFTDKRRLELEDFVGFGASEVMMTGLSRGLLTQP